MRGITNTPVEREYTVEEVSSLWSLHVRTVRRLFENEPGVVLVKYPSILPKRKFIALRIPESALVNVYTRLATGSDAK
jgi:hypothetical protein